MAEPPVGPRPSPSRAPRSPWARMIAAVVGATVLVTAGALVVAAAVVDGPATSNAPAVRVAVSGRPGDVATVSDIGELDADVRSAATAAAAAAGGSSVIARGAMVGMTEIRRGSTVVQTTAAGYRIPMVVTAMPASGIAGTMGGDVASALGPDRVAMGERSANLRGARAGDRIDLVGADGSSRTMTIALVGSDSQLGGTELVMTSEAADRLGITRDGWVAIWGFSSRSALDAELAARGLPTRRETRIRRSWDPPRPDATMSTSRVKLLLGEFSYLAGTSSPLTIDSAWRGANIPSSAETFPTGIRTRCHVDVRNDLRAALQQVVDEGLAGAIDVANANTYGGCYYPRFNRISGDVGFVSRHSWGMALDTNTVTNCQGCVPQMNCRVVQIFRRHGFAWGGNFTRPDGMHFEWVGERRDRIATPTPYCPNDVPAAVAETFAEADHTDAGRDALFADDAQTFGDGHAHTHAHGDHADD